MKKLIFLLMIILAQRISLAAMHSPRSIDKFLLNGLVYDTSKKPKRVAVKIFWNAGMLATVAKGAAFRCQNC